jgi:hypothetical protein
MAQKMARSRGCNMAYGKSIVVAVFVACAGFLALANTVKAEQIGIFATTSWSGGAGTEYFMRSPDAFVSTTTVDGAGPFPAIYSQYDDFGDLLASESAANVCQSAASFYAATFYANNATSTGVIISDDKNNGFNSGLGGTNPCSATSTYYILYWNSGGGYIGHVPYIWSAANQTQTFTIYTPPPPPPPPTPNENRWIVIDEPTYGTTTPSTTVSLSIRYNSQPGFDYLVLPPQKYGYDIFDAVTGALLYSFSQTLSENTAFSTTVSTTTIQSIGSKIIRAYIRNASTSVDLATPFETFYNVATNTYLIATGLNSPQDSGGGLTQNDCAIFDVGCQFQRALIFLFVPSSSLDKFRDLWTTLINIPPFGYVTVTIRQLQGIDASTTPAWTMPAAPFGDAIFTPIRTALAGILWGIFAFAFYRRLKTIEL